MKQSELLRRVEELERQVRELQARPVYVPVHPMYPKPEEWRAPYREVISWWEQPMRITFVDHTGN